MATDSIEISQQQAARVAGLGYLAIILLAVFAEFFVRTALFVPGDVTATVNNIMENDLLFRIGIISWIVVVACDVVVTWALYVLFKPVSHTIALLSSLFRLVYIAIKGAALVYFLFALQLLSGADYLSVFELGQLHAQVMLYLGGHNYGFLIGLVFFGIHCFILGYLVYKSGFFPKVIGILLMIACFGYLIDSFANFLMPNYASYQDMMLLVVAVPAFFAEISFCIWLLFKNIDKKQNSYKLPCAA